MRSRPIRLPRLELTAQKKVPNLQMKMNDAVDSPSKGVQSSFDTDHESVVTLDTGDPPICIA
jgi:hypothetical protein